MVSTVLRTGTGITFHWTCPADVAGRPDLGVELVAEGSSGVADVVASYFLGWPGVRDPDTTHANMVPGYNLPTAKCKHGKPGTRNTSKQ